MITTTPQDSNMQKAEVNINNFPGLKLDVNANDKNQIKGMPDVDKKPFDESITSFTEGTGKLVTSEVGGYFLLKKGNLGNALGSFKNIVTKIKTFAPAVSLSTNPFLVITCGRWSTFNKTTGIGDISSYFQNVGQAINAGAFIGISGVDYASSFNWVTAGGVHKPTPPLEGCIINSLNDNGSGVFRECAANASNVEHEIQPGTLVGNDWSGETMNQLWLHEMSATDSESYNYSTRIIELTSTLSDVELEKLALFCARNPYDLPDFLIGK